MGSRLSRQELSKIRKKLVLENIRRVFFASAAALLLIPVMMLINGKTASEFSATFKNALILFEVFSGVSLAVSAFALSSHNINLSRTVYRTFWLIFEMFSFVVIYADKVGGNHFTFYAGMAAALFLVPVMGLNEQMYYDVLLAVYTVFMGVKFGMSPMEIFDIIFINVIFIVMSRYLYSQLTEKLILREQAREVRDGETIDQMTGLLNRKGFEKRAYASIYECIGSRRRSAMLIVDIDDMSKYNDSFGTDRGDECIRTVAGVIRQVALRNTDMISRIDGGRFLIYMEGGNDMLPVGLAEKLRAAVENKRIPHGRRAANQFVTVSIGIASCVPHNESDFSELYDEAEDSLCEAKERGKNIIVYDEQIFGQYRKKAAY